MNRFALSRRNFLTAAGAIAFSFRASSSRAGKVDVVELSLQQIVQQLGSGALTARDLTQAYLARIEAVDRRGPALRSVIEVNPDALALASSLDAERKGGRVRGPLHGVPILVKDNIDTADRMKTTAGSLALVDAPAPKQDAAVVARLRNAGCVILGKSNPTEWANFRSTRMSSGWSARGGQTKNPYALDRTACGSSSGSGAAVAASLCAAALGTETLGSIQCPSSINGIAGIKPTIGLLPSTGIIPISHTLDTAGPMARSVRDAALLLSALTPFDVAALSRDALRGARVGITRELWGGDARGRSLLEAAVAFMHKAGAIVVEVKMDDGSVYFPAAFDIMKFEIKGDMGAYLMQREARQRSLADLIAFNEEQRQRELSLFNQELFEEANQTTGLETPRYRLALRAREQAQKETRELFAAHKLDVLFGPSAGLPPLIDHVMRESFDSVGSALVTVAGGPVVTVPGGLIAGLPYGFSFEGERGTDAKVIGIAAAFDDLAGLRRPPTYVASSSFGD